MKKINNLCMGLLVLLIYSLPLCAHAATVSQKENPEISTASKKITFSDVDILKSMKINHIPSVSIAIIDHGQIVLKKTYNIANDFKITAKTLFQAASISKPITAMIALSLVEKNQLNLDEDINHFLTTWKVPENTYTEKEKVTLRRLLSHTAGLTGPGNGFIGYSTLLKENDLPRLTEILNGEKPANSDPVVLNHVPGEKFSYSGGSYLIIQNAIENITYAKFSDLANQIVFLPLAMHSSTFNLIWPNNKKSYAIGHLADGSKVLGNWNLYPETAPAGLWTTPTDLAKFIIEIQQSFDGQSQKIISSNMVKQMLTQQPPSPWGLGMKLNKINDEIIEFRFSGSNVGYISYFIGFTKTGQGAVIMTNSDNGGAIISEIINDIAKAYDWPPGYTHA